MEKRYYIMAIAVILVGPFSIAVMAQDADEQRWLELASAFSALREARPADVTESGLSRFMQDQAKKAGLLADTIHDYLKDQPEGENVDEAWEAWMDLLNYSAESSVERKNELDDAERDYLSDPHLKLQRRITIRINQIYRTSDNQEAERLIRQTRAEVDGIRKNLPKNSTERGFGFPHDLFLLNLARNSNRENALRLCQEIIDSTKSGNPAHAQAAQLMSQLDRIGKKLELRTVDVNGKTIDLDEYHGKVVLLEFWATWCPPCVAGIPKVKGLREKHGPSGFEVIGMCCDTDLKNVQQFSEQHKLTWPQHFHELGMESPLIQSLGITALPSYWLINRSGVVLGIGGIDDLDEKLKCVLAEKQDSQQQGRGEDSVGDRRETPMIP